MHFTGEAFVVSLNSLDMLFRIFAGGLGFHPRDGPEPGPINLQDHNSEVRYRNIWFATKIGVGTTD